MSSNIKNRIIIIFFSVVAIGAFIASYVFYNSDYKYANYFVYIGIVITIISLAILFSQLLMIKQIRKEKYLESRLGMWNTISYRVKKAGESAFNELPIGILILSDNYDIAWSNSYAKRLFMSPLDKMNIQNININLFDKLIIGESKFKAFIYGKVYSVEYISEYNIVYLTDITKSEETENRYHQRMMAIGYINVDNLEDALADFDVQAKAEYMWKIIGIIAKWAESFGTYVRAYSDNRYIAVMDFSQLKAMMNSNFAILDDIKTVLQVSSIAKISLSIGIACIDEPVVDLSKHAMEQLELALNRGGDQAVILIDDEVTFYGAKTDAAPKETKVDIRIKSEELQELIKKSNRVLVVGHKALDADGFGGSFGIYKIAKSLEKEAYMVIDPNSIDKTVERIHDLIRREYVSLKDDIISPTEALLKMDEDTLLMVVDCQRDVLVLDSRLLKKAKKIGVIDHHRKGEGAIEKGVFYYTSTSASSSVELVVELLEFFEKDINFASIEATWLLLGIIVDTNNFIYRASSKTFEVASTLARYGADMTGVKQYLKEDIGDKIIRNGFIDNVEFYKSRIGIAVGQPEMIYERSMLAKISDEIISITDLDVGITLGYIAPKTVGISARSLGSINVQMLMEKMGGGGHLNNAAAQIKDKTIEEVIRTLKTYIDEHLNKEENMKVILTKEVKGRGKKNEIIELKAGFANHLIRSNQAIVASTENLKKLEEEKKQESLLAEKQLQDMKELKKVVESTPIKVFMKVGDGGKLFGSVSMKQVVDTFQKETGVTLDKRKINSMDNITALGEYKIPIQLHKEVLATITLHVVGKE